MARQFESLAEELREVAAQLQTSFESHSRRVLLRRLRRLIAEADALMQENDESELAA